ncbi:hypothetical protein BJV78DRAFT_1263948 [Lactifluus subvellereus]|nr:hypothetical protein BJV78DRAFT_1263948 [Lactifluus subvellereus]
MAGMAVLLPLFSERFAIFTSGYIQTQMTPRMYSAYHHTLYVATQTIAPERLPTLPTRFLPLTCLQSIPLIPHAP